MLDKKTNLQWKFFVSGVVYFYNHFNNFVYSLNCTTSPTIARFSSNVLQESYSSYVTAH